MKLRRITSGASWIPQIDGLRFVAIVVVVIFHCGGEIHIRGLGPVNPTGFTRWLDSLLRYGDRGVPIFFAISGYILARPFLRQYRRGEHPVKLGAYYLRRVTRLEPPYVLSLLIYSVAEHFDWHLPANVLLPHLFASLFYSHSIVYGQMSLISFVTWSLEVEIQFYLIAPLLGRIYKIESTAWRRGILVAAIILTSVISRFYFPYMFRFGLPRFLQFFLTGFLLADLLELPRHAVKTAWRWDLISLVGWPIIFTFPAVPWTLSLLPLFIVPTYLAAFYGKASNWFFRQPFVALTGGMCYSIYLMHTLILSTAFRFVKHLRLANDDATYFAQMSALVIAIFAVSTLYFVLVERPCMDPAWPKKLWHRLTVRQAHG